MTKAVIQGNYADLKYIKTRSVVQVVVEVPIERAGEVTDAFGWPQPGHEIPLALARLDPAVVGKEPEKPKRDFEDMPMSQQAGMLCEKPEFQGWILGQVWAQGRAWRMGTSAETMAADLVRDRCQVESRAELNGGHHAERWYALNAQYEADTRLAERRG